MEVWVYVKIQMNICLYVIQSKIQILLQFEFNFFKEFKLSLILHRIVY